MESAGRLATFCREVGAERAQIDAVGLGAGVVDRLAELMPELEVVEMSAGKKAGDEDHYANAGAEWYAALAEMLRDQRAGGQVFKNKRVVGELTSRKRRMRSDGRYELEPKHEAQRRGARSPDWGDAIAMCFAPRVRTGPEALIEYYLAHPEQRQQQPPSPMEYGLNRQTRRVELLPQSQVALAPQPLPPTPRRKTLSEVYLETRKICKEPTLPTLRGEVCRNCGTRLPPGDPYVSDGFDVWHHECPT